MENNESTQLLESKLCHQAGFLPVPLRSVPPASLEKLEIYLNNGQTYSLYRNVGLRFEPEDYKRLLNSGVEFVYVSVRDHQAYREWGYSTQECDRNNQQH